MWNIALPLLGVSTLAPLQSSVGPHARVAESPSGQYQLSIVKSSRTNALYSLSVGDTLLWKKEHSLVPDDALVTDSGTVAAYSNTEFPEDGRGEVLVACFDVSGLLLVDAAIPRRSVGLWPELLPVAEDIVVSDEANVLGVIVDDGSWLRFQLSSGEPLEPLERRQDIIGFVDAEAVVGTHLFLVHYIVKKKVQSAQGVSSYGARFDLVDGEGRTCWSKSLYGDYSSTTNERALRSVVAKVKRGGERFIRSRDRNSFELRCVVQGKWVTYYVSTRQAGGQNHCSVIERFRTDDPNPLAHIRFTEK